MNPYTAVHTLTFIREYEICVNVVLAGSTVGEE